ncbi:MAG: hypothetical protein JNN11_05535, partial [Candidatus Doudnabacteria bacterium]|nr:hypothetical protein [Candidatus Doudnabacteria bacterium]
MSEEKNSKFEGYISLSEASKQTGYHQDYLGYLCRVGKLKGFKIGRNWVTTQAHLDELMGAHTEEENVSLAKLASEPASI